MILLLIGIIIGYLLGAFADELIWNMFKKPFNLKITQEEIDEQLFKEELEAVNK